MFPSVAPIVRQVDSQGCRRGKVVSSGCANQGVGIQEKVGARQSVGLRYRQVGLRMLFSQTESGEVGTNGEGQTDQFIDRWQLCGSKPL